MLGHRADEVTEDDDDDVEIEEMAGPNRSSKRSHESDSNETDLVPKDLVSKDLIWLVIVVCSFKFVSHLECVILNVENFYCFNTPLSASLKGWAHEKSKGHLGCDQ